MFQTSKNITYIWINLNQRTFRIKTSEESSCFGSNVILSIAANNSMYFFARNGLSVRGYKVVDAQTEVLDINSVISLRDQIHGKQEILMIPEDVKKVIDHFLEDFTNRLKADDIWNSRFVTLSDQDILNETSIKWRWERLQFNIIKRWIDKDDKRIIDAPSGSGRFSIALAREYPEATVLGIDLLPQALNLGVLGAKLQHVANINFRQADILVLPEILRYEPKFDTALSVGLVQNMTEDDLHLLIEAFVRIVKPGGKLIISVPNGHSPIYRLWKLVVGENLKYRFGLERNVSPHEVIRLFRQNGLEDIEVEGTDPLYGLRKMYRVDPKTGSAIPFWWSKYIRVLGEFLDNCFIDPLDRVTKGWLSRHLGNDFIVKGRVSTILKDTPIGDSWVSSDVDPGSVQDIVEDQF